MTPDKLPTPAELRAIAKRLTFIADNVSTVIQEEIEEACDASVALLESVALALEYSDGVEELLATIERTPYLDQHGENADLLALARSLALRLAAAEGHRKDAEACMDMMRESANAAAIRRGPKP